MSERRVSTPTTRALKERLTSGAMNSGGPFPPSAATLKKYGLSEGEWLAILARQEGVCAVCKKVPNGRLCVDHDHVRGFKKLPPERRKLHVRGLLCWFCNHAYVGRGITLAKSENVTIYLRAHVERMAKYAKGFIPEAA